jgi:hypothetical protein
MKTKKKPVTRRNKSIPLHRYRWEINSCTGIVRASTMERATIRAIRHGFYFGYSQDHLYMEIRMLKINNDEKSKTTDIGL